MVYTFQATTFFQSGVYSHKYLESRSLGFNSANVFGLLKWLQTQDRVTRLVLIEIINFSSLGVTVIRCPKLINSFAHILAPNFAVTLASIGKDMEVCPLACHAIEFEPLQLKAHLKQN